MLVKFSNNCIFSEYHRQKTAQPSEDVVSVKIGAGQTSIANINDDNSGKPKFIKVSCLHFSVFVIHFGLSSTVYEREKLASDASQSKII